MEALLNTIIINVKVVSMVGYLFICVLSCKNDCTDLDESMHTVDNL